MKHIHVADGISWVEVPGADLRVLCGCPADSVKHLMMHGLIVSAEEQGVTFETGPNAILLSDVLIQNGLIANLAEFPVLQMLYKQGMLLPDHPNNTGAKPILIGSEEQVKAQMEYIYRGNYGLISEDELVGAGIDKGTARDIMRLKLKFAFGQIMPTEELLESRIVGSNPVEIKNGVTIRRLILNHFEFQYGDEAVTVDLNLPPKAGYGMPYNLGFHHINREYFGVIHSGDGDGWDINRPSMASILMFQGKIYLVDAGPNIAYSLKALGIGVNEIEGLFHTHAHDDHFCGLTTLANADHRIKYYATPVVRCSVQKKLAALTSIDEEEFHRLFEVHDLEYEAWNDVNSLEVKPIISPHPVETNILLFRAFGPEGYRTYAHWADIAAEAVLKKMVTSDKDEIGISQAYIDQVMENYLIPVDLKKIDIGGGLIHGDAEDFREDQSKKLLLSHTSLPLTDQQKEIGSSSPFGTVDVLVSSQHNYARQSAREYLESYFPRVPLHQLETLLNNCINTYNPESILLRANSIPENIHLLITGNVEMIHTETGVHNILSAGALVGEITGLMQTPTMETYRAENFVQALCIPTQLYLDFVKKNGFLEEIERLHDRRQFLQATSLFGEAISYPTQNKLALEMSSHSFPASHTFIPEDGQGLWLVATGSLERRINDDVLEILNPGDFFHEETILSNIPSIFHYHTTESIEAFLLPGELLVDIPVVRWKLFEAQRRRMRSLFDTTPGGDMAFTWHKEYSVHIRAMDEQHQKLFEMANTLCLAIDTTTEANALADTLNFLIDYTKFHFTAEEELMEKHGFPELGSHRKEHETLIREVQDLQEKFQTGQVQIDLNLVNFLKDWVLDHILTTDRKYSQFLNERGVT